ncbi:hypothetical protein SAMN05216525_1585 [Bradyrhizobium sp. Gha]|nr:hypothetical protein SAMN05216525_1585 [Bradyrhizobium sp. Gha]
MLGSVQRYFIRSFHPKYHSSSILNAPCRCRNVSDSLTKFACEKACIIEIAEAAIRANEHR